MAVSANKDTSKVISDVADFNLSSGSFVERSIFNNRLVIILICCCLSAFFAFEMLHLKLNANFNGTIPVTHPMMRNYLAHLSELQEQGNALRIVVEADKGTIDSADYLNTLGDLTTAVLDLPGVNRPFTTSLWTPTTRWIDINDAGFVGGQVVDSGYDGSPAAVATVMSNLSKTGRVGELYATDFKSSMIYAPLMDHNGVTNQPLDYGELARGLRNLRAQYASRGVTLHIIGYAMVVGDMILGIRKILMFFAFSTVIAAAMLYWFTRSGRCTFLVVACTLTAVVWQLGLLPLLGYDLDPYSVLVPFLIFAIGMSHGAQKMNGVMQDIGRGTHRLVAARYTFRRLFVAGFTALVCDAVGFGVLTIIQIHEIRELAIIASCGVAILIFTNLILLPILLSYVGVSKKAAIRSLRSEEAQQGESGPLWPLLARFTRRSWAVPVIGIALVLGIGGYAVGRHAQIGIVSSGAPELRYNSQYNVDGRYIENHYFESNDSLTVFADSQEYECTQFAELAAIDRLQWRLSQMPEVQSASSLSNVIQETTQLMNDDSLKWSALVDSQPLIDGLGPSLPPGFASFDCSFIPVNVSLHNLKAGTLNNVISVIEKFIVDPANQGSSFKLSLAGGNGGIAYATNQVISLANTNMLIWIYGAVSILCFIAFRSWLAVICAMVPLVLTSLLCKALMVILGIGITVATLPVVALGVGIGVDYALYMLGVMMQLLQTGVPLEEAYLRSLRFTGRVVMLTGFTLATGVGTWAFAPIKFQADMGILLAFMFLWNMIGALVLLPALASFLLKPKPAKPEGNDTTNKSFELASRHVGDSSNELLSLQ